MNWVADFSEPTIVIQPATDLNVNSVATAVAPAVTTSTSTSTASAVAPSPMRDAKQTKSELVSAIQMRNGSARADFLMRFDLPSLRNYLDRLTALAGHRGRDAVWVRRDETPAIVMRRVWPNKRRA